MEKKLNNYFKTGKQEVLEKTIAEEFKKIILNSKKQINLCLCTGNSPINIYHKLIELVEEKILTFKNISTYNLDEYYNLSENNPLSFRYFMKINLFDKIDIDLTKTHFPLNAKKYDKLLDNIDHFDLTLLGVGRNGHIAFNEPNSKFQRTHRVTLTKTTIADNFKNQKKFPEQAITMGLKDIFEKSKKIILIAWGEEKRSALKHFLQALNTNQIDPNWPITYFINHPNFYIYTNLKIN